MLDADQDYLQRRRQECLARADNASDPTIADVHRRFAAEYERKLSDGSFGAQGPAAAGGGHEQLNQ